MHLAWGDVAANDSVPTSCIQVHLNCSKCDQLGKGVDIFMVRTEHDVCPLTEILRYIELRGPALGLFRDHAPLTKSAFVRRVCEVLATLGLNTQDYDGHSFHIGAATAAGIEDSVID